MWRATSNLARIVVEETTAKVNAALAESGGVLARSSSAIQSLWFAGRSVQLIRNQLHTVPEESRSGYVCRWLWGWKS